MMSNSTSRNATAYLTKLSEWEVEEDRETYYFSSDTQTSR
jgi:PHD/YefM family antitoxin component YafN of YafNO toxin-antitoxin module